MLKRFSEWWTKRRQPKPKRMIDVERCFVKVYWVDMSKTSTFGPFTGRQYFMGRWWSTFYGSSSARAFIDSPDPIEVTPNEFVPRAAARRYELIIEEHLIEDYR
jgi:hypothetical protein